MAQMDFEMLKAENERLYQLVNQMNVTINRMIEAFIVNEKELYCHFEIIK
jgi:hypothetical protein